MEKSASGARFKVVAEDGVPRSGEVTFESAHTIGILGSGSRMIRRSSLLAVLTGSAEGVIRSRGLRQLHGEKAEAPAGPQFLNMRPRNVAEFEVELHPKFLDR